MNDMPLPEPEAQPAAPQSAPDEHEGVRAGSAPHGHDEVDWKKTAIAAVGIVGLGALAAVGLVLSKKQPPRKPAQAEQMGVRVALAKQRDVKPELVAYGRAKPSRFAIISAQVGGVAKVVHPDLSGGATIPAGSVVVQIDDADHRAEAQRQEAQVDAARAEVERLQAQIASTAARLLVARELLEVEERHLARTQAQFAKDVRTDREVETAKLLVLRGRDALLGLEATRDQLGPQLRAAQARLVEAQARHRLAEIDVERAKITLPYTGQISHVQIEQHQLIKPNQDLFVISDGSRMEVPAPLSISDALLLAGDLNQTPKGRPDEAERVVVEAEAGGASYQWSGVLVRFEPVDGETQTVKAVIEVENTPGKMPLLNDVFCRVKLQGAARVSGLMIPRDAVQERGMVYVVRDGKLAIVEPKLGRRVGEWVIVEEGMAADEQVIVSPLERVVEGTKLSVTEVAEWKKALAAAAKNPVFANLLMVFLIVAGFAAIKDMRREMFPEFNFDTVTVTAIYPGATPDDIERSITIKVEEAVRGVEGVYKIESTSSEGAAVVRIEIDDDVTDPRDALVDIRNEVSRITGFPDEVDDPEVKLIVNRRNVAEIVVTGDMRELSLTNLARELEEELLLIPEVSDLSVTGLRPLEIAVNVREADLQRYGLAFADVTRAIRQGSLDRPLGKLRSGTEERILRVQRQRQVGREMLDVPVVSRPDGSRVLLRDVADVADGFTEDESYLRINGKPAVQFTINKSKEADTIRVAEIVKEWMQRRRADLPEGASLEMWNDNSQSVVDRLGLLTENGMQGLVLVFIVLIIFFGFRLSFWVAFGLPVAFLTAMVLLLFFGGSLNMISSFGLIMILGILVDDAIVVGENIARHMREDGYTVASALRGLEEVTWPVIASVTTTAIAFLPLFYIGGIMGKFIKIMPVAVIACLIASLIECLLILPAHLAHAKKPARTGTNLQRFRARIEAWSDRFIDQRYGPTVDWALRNRYIMIAAATAFLIVIAGLLASGRPAFIFFPRLDSKMIEAKVTMPQGTSLEETRKVIERLASAAGELREEYGMARDGEPIVRRVMTRLGDGGSHKGWVKLELARSSQRDIKGFAISKDWRQRVGPLPQVRSLVMGGTRHRPGGRPLELRVLTNDTERAKRVSGEVRENWGSYPGVFNIEDNLEPGKRELRLDVKPMADALGVRVGDLASQLYAGFSGEEVHTIQRGRDEVEVRVRYGTALRQTATQLEDMRLRRGGSGLLPLGWAATVERGRSLSRIERRDGRRQVSLSADVDDATSNANLVASDMKTATVPDLEARYPGTFFVFGGQQEEQAKTMESLRTGFLLAMLGIYAILSLLFGSYTQPLIVMCVIPLGFGGAIVGHLVMGLPLMIFSVFGMVGLTGIVVNDSLVLIDFINRRRSAGEVAIDAASQAGRVRFRPVFLTTVTTVVGLLPIMLETSLQAQFVIPMALSIASGVFTATILTLYVVPCVYLALEDVRSLFMRPAPTAEKLAPAAA